MMRFLGHLFSQTEPTEDVWTLYHGTLGGKQTISRVNMTVGKRRDLRRRLKHGVKIVIPIREPDVNGFARGTEADELERIEERLDREIATGEHTVLAGVISSEGMREFALYTDSPDQTSEDLGRLANQITTHDLQYLIQADPDWDVYRQFRGR